MQGWKDCASNNLKLVYLKYMDKIKRIQLWKKLIFEFSKNNKVFVKEISKNQIRVYAKEKIDIYPKAKRYHNITLNIRGDIELIKPFLETIKTK